MALSPGDIQKLVDNGSITQPTADLMNSKNAPIDTSPITAGNPYSMANDPNALASNSVPPGGDALAQKLVAATSPAGVFSAPSQPAQFGPPANLAPAQSHQSPQNLSPNIPVAQSTADIATPIATPVPTEAVSKPSTGQSASKAPVDPDFKTGDSTEENERLAQIDSKKAEIDESVANGEIDPASALQQKQALDGDAGNVKNKYNFTPQGYFDWKNAQAHPELYSYGRLKSGFIGDQLNYQDQNSKLDTKINDAMAAKTEAEKARDEAVASQYGEQAAQAQKNQTELQNWQNDFNTKTDELNKQKQAAVDQYMNTQVDPNKYYKDLGIGGGIVAALTAGLAGAFLNRAEGKSVDNPVVRQINMNVDRDIEAQKTQLAKSRDLVNIKDNDIATFMKQGFDQKDAILMAQKIGYQKAENLLNQTLVKYNSPVATANAQVIAAGLQQQQAAVDHALSNNTAQLILGQRAPHPVAATDSVDPDTVMSVDGHQVAFTNKGEATNATKIIPAIDQTTDAVNVLLKNLRDGKNGTAAERAVNHQLFGTVMGHVSELSSDSTRFNPEETKARVGELDPSLWNTNTDGSRQAAGSAFLNELAKQRHDILNNAIPVSKGIIHNAKTNKNEVGFQIGRGGNKPAPTGPTVEGAPTK
jgi:hypothetical protein